MRASAPLLVGRSVLPCATSSAKRHFRNRALRVGRSAPHWFHHVMGRHRRESALVEPRSPLPQLVRACGDQAGSSGPLSCEVASGPGGISRRGFLGTQTSLPIPRAEPIAVLPRRGWSVGGRSSSSRARSGSTRSGSAGPAILDSPGVTASSTGGGGRQSPPSVCMTATSSPGSSASTGDPAETGERYPAGRRHDVLLVIHA